MILALEQLSAGWQAVIYAVAIALFVAYAFGVRTARVHLGWLGLGFAFFPLFFNNLVDA